MPVVVGATPGIENAGGEGELANARKFGKVSGMGLGLGLVLGYFRLRLGLRLRLSPSPNPNKGPWGALQLVLHLVIGWPAYLLWGATGGPKYGTSTLTPPFNPNSTSM